MAEVLCVVCEAGGWDALGADAGHTLGDYQVLTHFKKMWETTNTRTSFNIIHTPDDLSRVHTPVVLTDHMIKCDFSRKTNMEADQCRQLAVKARVEFCTEKIKRTWGTRVKSWLTGWYRPGSYTLQSWETVLFVFAAMFVTVKVCFWLPMLPARSWDCKYQRYLLSCVIQNQRGSNWIGSSEVIVLRPHTWGVCEQMMVWDQRQIRARIGLKIV